MGSGQVSSRLPAEEIESRDLPSAVSRVPRVLAQSRCGSLYLPVDAPAVPRPLLPLPLLPTSPRALAAPCAPRAHEACADPRIRPLPATRLARR